MDPLPTFRLHPDPLASGALAPGRRRCRCCGRSRGMLYEGPVYAQEELSGRLCPWCIADGSAASKFGATFTDAHDLAPGISPAEAAEVCERTPGYAAWGAARWLACCGGAAAFLGPMGIQEIRAKCHELEGVLMGDVVHRLGISGGAAVRAIEGLSRDGSPVAMVFRCPRCGVHLGFVDAMLEVEGC